MPFFNPSSGGLPSTGILPDASSNSSVDWYNRTLVNDAGVSTVLWNARTLLSGINQSVDWGNRLLQDTTEADVLDWSSYANVKMAGAASKPGLGLTGTIFTGGTGTTTFPLFLVQPSGATAATSWSTSGTVFGANAPTGFVGNYIDLKLAGASNSAAKLTYNSKFTLIGVDSEINLNYPNETSLCIQWGSMFMMKDFAFVWSSSGSSHSSGRDVGFGRASARRMKITNASSGFGDLQIRNLVPDTTLTTNMTDGFFNLPGAAGAPSGVPSVTTGFPAYWDSTNLQLCIYTGGAWKKSAAFT